MFAEVKESLPISGDDYDAQIIREIKACALDLTTSAEIDLGGDVSITRTQDPQTGAWTIADTSTITDPLILKTIAVWCDKEIGNPPNYANLQAAYNSLKGQLRLSNKYTNYHPEDQETEPEGPEGPEDGNDEEAAEG